MLQAGRSRNAGGDTSDGLRGYVSESELLDQYSKPFSIPNLKTDE